MTSSLSFPGCSHPGFVVAPSHGFRLRRSGRLVASGSSELGASESVHSVLSLRHILAFVRCELESPLVPSLTAARLGLWPCGLAIVALPLVKHCPGKAQTHVDGLSRLQVDPAPPDVLLHIRLLENEEEAWKLAQELHSVTHLGRQALWKLFRDRYDFKSGRRICLEVAQSCPQCQMGSDYGHCQKTTGAIQSRGPWDTLSIDIVGPLPADHR